MQPDPNAVQIYVDGSCFVRQGRRSGYAGYVVYPDGSVSPEPVLFKGFEESSIQRMELGAVIAAMEWVIDELRPPPTRVQIFSDSQVTLNLIRAVPYLQKRKWKNAEGRAIDHEDLWRKFQSVRGKVRAPIHFGKVQGKSSHLLRLVDKAAKQAALSGTAVDRGYRLGKVGRPTVSGGSARLFPAAGQQVVIRIYGSKLVGKEGENRFKFQLRDTTTGEFSQVHSRRFSRARCDATPGARLSGTDERQSTLSSDYPSARRIPAPNSSEETPFYPTSCG